MNKCGIIILILFFLVHLGGQLKNYEKVQITKKEYLQLVIGSYVWGLIRINGVLFLLNCMAIHYRIQCIFL